MNKYKRCNTDGCTKSARSKSEHCKAHGGGKRCITDGCTKSAESKSEHCKAHGGGVRCITGGCTKSARSKSKHCVAHGGARCITDGCTKSAQGKSKHCIAHGGGKRCITDGCTKSAQGKTSHCKAHGGGKRCPNCIDWPDSRGGWRKYDGYCATCFKRLFPEDPRSTHIYEHTKEIMVRNVINDNFEGFVHDKPLYTHNCECVCRRRIDHRKLINNTMLAIETDEHGHAGYDSYDEKIRHDDLYMIHSGKWVYIRFNPDNTRKCKVNIKDRIRTLIDTIKTQIMRIQTGENHDLVEIIKLFY